MHPGGGFDPPEIVPPYLLKMADDFTEYFRPVLDLTQSPTWQRVRRVIEDVAQANRIAIFRQAELTDMVARFAEAQPTYEYLGRFATEVREYLPTTPEQIAEVENAAAQIVADPEGVEAVNRISDAVRHLDLSALIARAGPYAIVLVLWASLAIYVGPQPQGQILVMTFVLILAQALGLFPPQS
jgi:hypothetical protein